MKILNISYDIWVNIVNKNNFKVYYMADGETYGDVWCGTDQIIYQTKITSNYWDNFNDNYPINVRINVDRIDDAIASILGLDNVPHTPRTSDGKPITLPSLFPGNITNNYVGVGDDDIIGKYQGPKFNLELSEQGTQSLIWNFIDWVYIAGGIINYLNANLGDHISYEIFAPNTYCIPNTGNGQFDIINHIFVPNINNNGAYDLDLNLVVPVPSPTQEGFFDYDLETNLITINTEQKGLYNAFDIDIILSRFAACVPLLGNGYISLMIPAIKPKKIFKSWKHKATISHGPGDHNLKVSWMLYLGRLNT